MTMQDRLPSHPTTTPVPGSRGSAGRKAMLRNSAVRALDDPVKLDRAVRIVREALRHERVTLADLVGNEGEVAE